MNISYKSSAFYSQVAGLADSTGSTPPSDIARATGAGSIAIGSNAYTALSGTAGTSVGVHAYTSASDAVALGSGSVANQSNTVSVGSDGTTSYTAYDVNGNPYTIQNQANARRIVNMAAGQSDHDAVNVSQLKDVTTALGGGSAMNVDGSIKAPTYTVAGTTYNNVGDAIAAVANGGGGGSVDALNWNSTATAYSAKHGGASQKITDVANGVVASTSTDAINGSQLAGTAQSVADSLGGGATVDANGKVTKPKYSVGGKSVDGVDGAVSALDAADQKMAGDITTISNQISNGSVGLVQQTAKGGNLTVGAANDGLAVDFKGTAGNRKLINVANGGVSASSTDAVNGGQLYGVSQFIANIAGGGSKVNADGTVTSPTYQIHDANGSTTTVNNVGDAITTMDSRIANISTSGAPVKFFHTNTTGADSAATGNESVAIGGNAKATADNTVALGSNSVADRANTVSVGTQGAERQITNVAAGTADTDAVNVAQLKSAGVVNGDGSTNTTVTYDHNANGSSDSNSITLAGGNAGTVIHNVANGTSASDAVNKGQMDAALNNVVAQSGGNPMFQANGDRATEQSAATGNHAVAMGANASATADNSVALGAGSVADRANAVSVGSAGNERQITNVAAGTSATDAANVAQVQSAASKATSDANAYTDSQMGNVQNALSSMQQQLGDQFNKIDKRIASGNAMSAAMMTMGASLSNIPGTENRIGAGTGYANGRSALSVGYQRALGQKTNLTFGASTSGHDTSVGVGVGMGW